MCGIVAIYSPNDRVSPETLARATARLHHRGPDAQRHWIAPHGRVGLGHARLSIIDLVTGDQPIASEDGRRQLIVNGELYDYQRIRRDLAPRRGAPAPARRSWLCGAPAPLRVRGLPMFGRADSYNPSEARPGPNILPDVGAVDQDPA